MTKLRCPYNAPLIKVISMAEMTPILQASLDGFLIEVPVSGEEIGENEE